ELDLHEAEESTVVRRGILDLLGVLEQQGPGIRVDLLLRQQVLDQDAPDHLSRSALVLDVGELSRDQPLDHGLRHPSRDLLSSNHDSGRSGYMGPEGVSRRTIRKVRKNMRLVTGQEEPESRPLSRQALDLDAASMGFDERPNHAEPKPEATHGSRLTVRHAHI